MPGRGTVDRGLWENRLRDPARLRLEFDGPKGRGWLMRWLPARAYENGVYYVFSNAIGWDYDTVKPGLAMILDPYGEIIAESRALDDDVVVGLLTEGKIENSSGRRYLKARRPELYARMVEPQESVTLPGREMERR
jgi:predicted amidohydrolase